MDPTADGEYAATRLLGESERCRSSRGAFGERRLASGTGVLPQIGAVTSSGPHEPVGVSLRAVERADVPIFFEHQLDAAANVMAAFTSSDPSDRAAYAAKWEKNLSDPSIVARTIEVGGEVAGYVASFERLGKREVCYWLGPKCWGRGIATAALSLFLPALRTRPLYARVAADNRGSIRVLEKCGFVVCGRERFFASARGAEIDELVLELTRG